MLNNYFNFKKVMTITLSILFFSLNAQECISPSAISSGATGITHTRINWTSQPTPPGLGYDWQLTLANTTEVLQSGTVNSPTLLITELLPLTAYQVKIRSHCTSDTYSDWNMKNFSTLPISSALEGIIGTGADANAFFSASYGPIMYAGIASRNGSVANMLFTSAEMQAIGIPAGAEITGVAFDKVNASYGGDNYPDLRLRMFAKSSSTQAPLDMTTTYGDILSTHIEVMDNPAYDLPATIGWIDFNFDFPVTYNGDSFELATAMYQNGQTAQFSTYVIWQYTAGSKDYMIGAWPINTVPMDENLVLNHFSGAGQYKDRPNAKIYYNASNTPISLDIHGQNASNAITENQGTFQLNTIITPLYVSQEAIWQITSGAEYAAISSNGLITALANGTITVQAVSPDDATLIDTIQITISGQMDPVTGIEISVAQNLPAAITIDNGTLQLDAEVLPSNSNQDVTWSIITGTEYAFIDDNGLVTAINNGTIIVQAISNENTTILDTIEIIITGQILPVVSIEISVEEDLPAVIITDNGTLQLVAALLPSNSNQDVTWSIIAGTEYASINANGLVTAINNGTITVQVVSNENNTILDTIEIIITGQIVAVNSIEITVANNAAAIITTNGGTLQLNAVILPENSNQNVVWSVISGNEIATIDSNGLVTATNNGTATIQAVSTENNAVSDTIEITVSGQTLGIDNFNTTDLIIYPNPANTVITLQSQYEIHIVTLYTIQGQKVLESDKNTINIESLPQGSYILTAKSREGKTLTKRIIKN